jgi:hypothetical protein
MRGFQLSKWYADCISDKGQAVILYHAELSWGAVSFPYSSVLIVEPQKSSRTLYSLRRHPSPKVHDAGIECQCPDWRFAGQWQQLGPAHADTLFQSESGSLEWNCLAPRAVANVQVGEEPVTEGWGYVEYLRLTLPPWKLPISRLRWGRFVNATDALVWIDWNGTYNKRVAYLNGQPVLPSAISDSEVVLSEEGATLYLADKNVIREGRLGETALSVIANLDRIFPQSVSNMRECKWLSRATLRRPGLPDSIGFAIHEVVEWP